MKPNVKPLRTIDGHCYIGQYADKYYLLDVNFSAAVLTIYDRTKSQIKQLKVSSRDTVRINGETLSIYDLNG